MMNFASANVRINSAARRRHGCGDQENGQHHCREQKAQLALSQILRSSTSPNSPSGLIINTRSMMR